MSKLTKELLNLDPIKEKNIQELRAAGEKYQRIGWVEQYIKFYSDAYKEGRSVESVIRGAQLADEDAFCEMMRIAEEEYGVTGLNYKRFEHLTFDAAKEINKRYSGGEKAKDLSSEYQLLNERVVKTLDKKIEEAQ
ncbi:MAG: hypothetical protein ABIC91_06845 [Nanoarchaeota archaeon]|nr:hypothetical protein [Nanoarchaeota archaeon]